MTGPNLHIDNARVMLAEDSERSFVRDTLHGLLDIIQKQREQLDWERESHRRTQRKLADEKEGHIYTMQNQREDMR